MIQYLNILFKVFLGLFVFFTGGTLLYFLTDGYTRGIPWKEMLSIDFKNIIGKMFNNNQKG